MNKIRITDEYSEKKKRNILCMIKSDYNLSSTYAYMENDDGYSMKKTENMSGTQNTIQSF